MSAPRAHYTLTIHFTVGLRRISFFSEIRSPRSVNPFMPNDSLPPPKKITPRRSPYWLVPVKIYTKIIIRYCTVPVEFCAALLFMWLCRFIFGDCLPLSLVLHHLPTSINRATTTPIFAQHRISTKRVDLITHPQHHSSI